jgi:N-acetylmuramoyl-L-alanine amidase
MLPRLKHCLGLAILLSGIAAAQPQPSNAVTAIRHWTLNDVTRIIIETTENVEYKSDRVPNPDRLFFDFDGTRLRLGQRGLISYPVNDSRLKQIRVAQTSPTVARIVFDLADGVEFTASRLANPARVIVELRNSAVPPVVPPVQTPPPPLVISKQTEKRAPEPVLTDATPPALAKATPATISANAPVSVPVPSKAAKLGGSQSMTRVLGLKIGRIVLDAGHGGHDTGTAGPNGLLEKYLVLDVTHRLGALIESKLGAEVVYTRGDDTFIPLERRTAIANEQKADLFLSVHANSSPAASSSGVETYYLNFTSNKAAMEVAARENASSQKTVFELRDLLQKIAIQDKVDESRQFAEHIQQSLYAGSVRLNPRTRDRGVRKAPFVVLIGANMPSVLAEIGFVSNPRDESLLKRPEIRQKIAESLFKGLQRYGSTLSHFEVAKK